MSVETVRRICRAFPGVTEDIKWGNDLVFSVGDRMFAVVDLEPPYAVAFKCTGIIPAPYLARAMWVRETAFGDALDLRELAEFLRQAYDAVAARLPKSRRPGAVSPAKKRRVKKGKARR